MNLTKKTLAFLLAAVLSAGVFAGCGGGSSSSSTGTSAGGVGGTDFNYSDGLDEHGRWEGITALDLVKLGDYKGVEVPADVHTVKEEDVDAQVQSMLSSYATTNQVLDREVKDGDTVNIDYVGKVDGVEFEGGSTEGTGESVTIGVTNYIDGFLEQLIGHKPGETFDIEVTFPEVYETNPDLQGKDAVFTVTINYIHGDEIIPELSDEIAADYGFTTVDELKDDIAKWLVSTQKSEYMQTLLSSATCKQEVPESVLNYVIESELAQYSYYADLYGLDLDGFLAAYSEYDSKDAYIEANQAAFEETAVYYLALQAIAEAEQLSVDAQTLEDSGYADYVASYGEPYVKMIVLQETVVPNFIFDHAVS